MTEEVLSDSQQPIAGKDVGSGQVPQNRGNDQGHVRVKRNERDIEVDPDSQVEVEVDDPKIRIERPFDPEKIKIRSTNITVELLVSRLKHGEIDLAPDFQRSFLWKEERQS